MAKKTPVVVKTAARKPAAKAKPGLKAVIDYPLPGESVRPGHYAIRLTAAGATQAQVRFDGDEWSECRESYGHFWYDWAPRSGCVRIETRARRGKGRWSPVAGVEASVVTNETCLVA